MRVRRAFWDYVLELVVAWETRRLTNAARKVQRRRGWMWE